jgi:segregation and condensation protein A
LTQVREIIPALPENAEAFRFVLPRFEGPLDLLLHLIRINEVDIRDIPVLEIARQYDEMLDLMRELNLDTAGEFLVMAATLVYIKSRLLLPAEQERVQAGEIEDPRAGLVQALLEHQRFRQAAASLAERERAASLVFTRPAGPETEEEGYLEVSLFDLLTVLKDMLRTARGRAALLRPRAEIPLAERIREVLERLEAEAVIPFTRLLGECPSVEMILVTFLAVLELVRMGSARVAQAMPTAEIRVLRAAA